MWIEIEYKEYWGILNKLVNELVGEKFVPSMMVWKDANGKYVAKSNGYKFWKWEK